MLTSLFNGKPRIEQWFPKPIYIHNNFYTEGHSELHRWLLDYFEQGMVTKRTPELNVSSTHMVNNFNNEPIFQPLIEAIREEVLNFAITLGYDISVFHLPLLNIWANLSETGDHLFPHNHPGSFISGAYYIECDSDLDVIKFYNDTNNMITPSPFPNNYSFEDASYVCEPKRLLLFKSNFIHGCPAIKGKRKIVVSFNFNLL